MCEGWQEVRHFGLDGVHKERREDGRARIVVDLGEGGWHKGKPPAIGPRYPIHLERHDDGRTRIVVEMDEKQREAFLRGARCHAVFPCRSNVRGTPLWSGTHVTVWNDGVDDAPIYPAEREGAT